MAKAKINSKTRTSKTTTSKTHSAKASTSALPSSPLSESVLSKASQAKLLKTAQKTSTKQKPRQPVKSPPNKAQKTEPLTHDACNDLDLNHWRDYDDIETDSLWLFPNRSKQDGHQLDYHGNCVPQILTQCLSRYTKAGEIVLDLFLGSGTTAIEALNLNRRCVGVELQPELAQYVREKLKTQTKKDQKTSDVEVIQGDSRDGRWTGKAIHRALNKMGEDKAQFLFLHPPYADIIKFSEADACLSNAESTEAFLDQFQQVAQVGYSQLAKGRYAAVVIGDKYSQGEWIPLGFYCLERMNQVGFKTKSIIVKNMVGNERGKGKAGNLWRYRALKGGFYIFKHEYVFIFQKL